MGGTLRKFIRGGFAFAASREGSVLPLMALLAIPIFAGIGAAVDYSRATTARTQVQVALDSALLAGAQDASANWSTVALNAFTANPNTIGANVGTPSFTVDQAGTYHATITGSVGTSVMAALGISTIPISAASSVAPGSGTENSCILTLDHAQSSADLSLTLNGAPVLTLSGCGIRSNTSMNCNGHNGNSTASIASGNVSNCSNPTNKALSVPDIYAKLNTNITFQCPKGSTSGATWDASSGPPAGLITITQTYGTEYHVCGDLTLTGTGYLTGASPSSDTIVVVENGNLNVAANANVNTVRMTIILTGDNTVPSAITFPNGNGHAATLSVSPSTSPGNPWIGISIYQDPVLTTATDSAWGVGDTFGPGATFNADGVVYLPRSNVTWHGSGASNNNKCTKFVFNTFTTDGSVNLNFAQSDGCTTLGVQQWVAVPIHLAQ